ncbi:histidine phosphatase family protein [Bacillus sp. V59.32b]|uniref:histidine phosphatase family protein n=1 Tax=Bacillus sp. V59.32b TaxID=1758642 RepID=UPI000E3B8FAC|nr:histidine phosphatase family protein [Bacillus sp. V59.32b]RFU67950.1 histidine phosphatase family protein [Bacillus sp. V59.32b]
MDGNLVITLFRHGLTVANERKAYIGWSDSPLSRKGKAQLFPLVIDAPLIFSSDLKRCTDTVAILFPERSVIQKKELRELHFGKWEGKTYEDLKEDSDYKKWLENPFAEIPPNGEGFDQFAARIQHSWKSVKEQMAKQGIKRAAIVTHGGVIRYLLMKYAPVEKPFWEWGIPHGKGWEMTFDTEDLRRDGRCILLREALITANPSGSGNIIKEKGK